MYKRVVRKDYCVLKFMAAAAMCALGLFVLWGCGAAGDRGGVSSVPAHSREPVASDKGQEAAPSGGQGGGSRDATAVVLTPEAPGTDVIGVDGKVSIDISNVNHGYVTVLYSGDNDKVKFRISSGGEEYNYDLQPGSADVFPLTHGDGSYEFTVLEHEAGTEKSYSKLFTGNAEVQLENEFEPFLYPNQYVEFTPGSMAVEQGEKLAQGADGDLEVVGRVYDFVVKNVSYDYDLAKQVENTSGYIPNVDEVLQTKKGICFDYAALMSAMLRSQRIPTRLVIGYVSGDAVGQQVYHAWISVYIEGEGWIDNIIYFDGTDWVRMDPTLASTNGIGDENQYNALYYF